LTDTEDADSDAEEADSDTEETPEYSEMDTDISTNTSTSGGIGIHWVIPAFQTNRSYYMFDSKYSFLGQGKK